jgi:hypothetical protein
VAVAAAAFFPELLLLNTFLKLFMPEFLLAFFPLLLKGIRLFTAGATEFTAEFTALTVVVAAEFIAAVVVVAAEFTAEFTALRVEFTAVVSVLVVEFAAEFAAFVRLFKAFDANVPVLNIELILCIVKITNEP